jgi:hypothetical protein
LIISPITITSPHPNESHYAGERRYKTFQKILTMLKDDPHFLAFHCGETEQLPDYYAREYQRIMGKYTELVPLSESTIHDFERGEVVFNREMLLDIKLPEEIISP